MTLDGIVDDALDDIVDDASDDIWSSPPSPHTIHNDFCCENRLRTV